MVFSREAFVTVWRDPVYAHVEECGKCTMEAQARVLASRGRKGYIPGTCPQTCPLGCPGPSTKPPLLLLQVAGNTFPCNLAVQGCDTFWLNNARSDELKEEFSKNNNSRWSQRSQYTHGACWPTWAARQSLIVCAKPSMALDVECQHRRSDSFPCAQEGMLLVLSSCGVRGPQLISSLTRSL